jgi:hypothetical protein
MRREWCDAEPETLPDAAKPRFRRLYDFLASGSQYFDSVYWLAEQLTEEMPDEAIGIYAGAQRSGVTAGTAQGPRPATASKRSTGRTAPGSSTPTRAEGR